MYSTDGTFDNSDVKPGEGNTLIIPKVQMERTQSLQQVVNWPQITQEMAINL